MATKRLALNLKEAVGTGRWKEEKKKPDSRVWFDVVESLERLELL